MRTVKPKGKNGHSKRKQSNVVSNQTVHPSQYWQFELLANVSSQRSKRASKLDSSAFNFSSQQITQKANLVDLKSQNRQKSKKNSNVKRSGSSITKGNVHSANIYSKETKSTHKNRSSSKHRSKRKIDNSLRDKTNLQIYHDSVGGQFYQKEFNQGNISPNLNKSGGGQRQKGKNFRTRSNSGQITEKYDHLTSAKRFEEKSKREKLKPDLNRSKEAPVEADGIVRRRNTTHKGDISRMT